MIGLDVTHQAVIRPEHSERLRSSGRVGAMVAELVDFYGKFHGRSYPELGGSPMHDPSRSPTSQHPGWSKWGSSR